MTEPETLPTTTINEVGGKLNDLAINIQAAITQVIEDRDQFLSAFETLRMNVNKSIDQAIETVHQNADELQARLTRLI